MSLSHIDHFQSQFEFLSQLLIKSRSFIILVPTNIVGQQKNRQKGDSFYPTKKDSIYTT